MKLGQCSRTQEIFLLTLRRFYLNKQVGEYNLDVLKYCIGACVEMEKIKELTIQETQQISGGGCTPKGALNSTIEAGVVGGISGAIGGPTALFGASVGVLSGFGGYMATCWW